MEREAFRQRMQQYKQARENNPQLKYWDWKKENDLGYQLYKNNLPSNLQVETDDYDLYGAYESNMQPELNEDGTYHLGSRDPYTGRILISKLQKQSDWNDLRNRSIERLYDPEVRARAAKIKSDYNVDLQSTYDKIINQYENDYFSLPEAEIMQLQDAKAMIDLQEEAARRYKQYGIKPTQKDFRIKIDNAVTPSQEITNHEINHFNQYIHQDSPSWNKSELDKITKQFKGKLRDKNPIDPENTSYFMKKFTRYGFY